jgi:hypothetical protein
MSAPAVVLSRETGKPITRFDTTSEANKEYHFMVDNSYEINGVKYTCVDLVPLEHITYIILEPA